MFFFLDVFAPSRQSLKRAPVKLFDCQFCGNILYFENRTCGQCGHRLGFQPEPDEMTALDSFGDGWRPVGSQGVTPLFLRQCHV